jgi:hypothetical protein
MVSIYLYKSCTRSLCFGSQMANRRVSPPPLHNACPESGRLPRVRRHKLRASPSHWSPSPARASRVIHKRMPRLGLRLLVLKMVQELLRHLHREIPTPPTLGVTMKTAGVVPWHPHPLRLQPQRQSHLPHLSPQVLNSTSVNLVILLYSPLL